MIIIDICFSTKKYDKIYQYLLVNSGNFKINKDLPLVETRGATTSAPINSYLYIRGARRVDQLPAVVTKQIVILDDKNCIRVENVGRVTAPMAEPVPVISKKEPEISKKKVKESKSKKARKLPYFLDEKKLKRILY